MFIPLQQYLPLAVLKQTVANEDIKLVPALQQYLPLAVLKQYHKHLL